jgi:hypothetical protein
MATGTRQNREIRVGRILLWEGRVSRARLIAEFDLSPIRASEWLRDFRESYPSWSTWDTKLKADVATHSAYVAADRAGAELMTKHPQHDVAVMSPAAAMLEPYQSNDVGRLLSQAWDFTRTSPHTFSRLNLAITDRVRVKFMYCSMGNPEPHERLIEPHSIVKTGRRWHVRGYCVEKQDFRDFVLGRMSKVKLLTEPHTSDSASDLAWSTQVDVRIIAHPKLNEAQQQVVRNEYFNGTSARVERCRAALLNYMIQEIRAATNVDHQTPPDYQLAIWNIDECRPWLFPA